MTCPSPIFILPLFFHFLFVYLLPVWYWFFSMKLGCNPFVKWKNWHSICVSFQGGMAPAKFTCHVNAHVYRASTLSIQKSQGREFFSTKITGQGLFQHWNHGARTFLYMIITGRILFLDFTNHGAQSFFGKKKSRGAEFCCLKNHGVESFSALENHGA